MPHIIIDVIHNINDYQTPIGKIGLAIEGIGVTLSVGFYGLGLGGVINAIAPPIILVLTVLSIAVNLAYRCYSWRKEWMKTRKK